MDMKLSVCVDAVYHRRDTFESLKEIKGLGIGAYEFWVWWDKDLTPYRRGVEELGLDISCFCTKFIPLTEPDRRGSYVKGLEESIQAAKALGVKRLISQAGNEVSGVSRQAQQDSIVDGLKACVPLLEASGITLLLEPLNTKVDHMGYYLYSSDEAFEIVAETASPSVKVLFDIYHQQIMEGNLIARLQKNIGKIGHFHAAGNPGRHELDDGEINYKAIFTAIRETGYDGYMGLEYFPRRDPSEGLSRILSWDGFDK